MEIASEWDLLKMKEKLLRPALVYVMFSFWIEHVGQYHKQKNVYIQRDNLTTATSDRQR